MAEIETDNRDDGTRLHDSCLEVREVVRSAIEMAGALAEDSTLAEEMDGPTEQAIAKAVDLLNQAEAALTQAEESLVERRGDLEDEEGEPVEDDEAQEPDLLEG